jgi:acyl carrier protein
MHVRDRVCRVVAAQFRVAESSIGDDATLDGELHATSLDRVELVMALEDEFAIEISDNQAGELHTVRDVMACVNANLVQARPRQARPGPGASARD